ncbi:PQQ-binding-like beta-propeller repeat protein [Vicingaceae bacterium]|nr:PQQ-binding-like beta-propeller repeat protein [Vicingaceae bacterium]
MNRISLLKHTVRVSLVLLIGVFWIAVPSIAQEVHDWPRWSGPNGDMISNESGWQTDWSMGEPERKWTQDIGTGFSSVSVVGDRVFTMGRDGDDDVVYCLNAVDGEKIWEQKYECKLVANMHEGGPGGTPTVTDGKVYTYSREAHVHCFDAESGEPIWDRFLPDETGVKHPTWGFTSSPLVVGDFVYVDAGRIVALNKNTGETIWQTDKMKPGYGSVTSYDHNGTPAVAVLNNAGLYLHDGETGKQISFSKWVTMFDTNSTTPVIEGNKFFVSTGYKRGCGMFELNDGEFSQVFTNRNLSNHMNQSVWYEGHIYGVNGNSNMSRACTLVCMNAETGKIEWSERGMGCGSLMIADGHLIVLGDKGELKCAKASPDGFEPTGSIQVAKGRCWTVPVLANGRVYCRTAKGALVCLELAKK